MQIRRRRLDPFIWDPEPQELCDLIDSISDATENQRKRDLTRLTRPTHAPRTTSPDRKRTRVRFT